mgnify:CR=1 FL=1
MCKQHRVGPVLSHFNALEAKFLEVHFLELNLLGTCLRKKGLLHLLNH